MSSRRELVAPGLAAAGTMEPMADDDRYRPNVGLCVFNNSNGWIFTAQRVEEGEWQMPQGGIDPGEDPQAAALRELREETGMSSVEVVAKTEGWLRYDFPPDVKARLSSYWQQYDGQKQMWFLLEFTGSPQEIDVASTEEAPEFRCWRWAPLPEVAQEVVAFKRPVYDQVLWQFQPIIADRVAAKRAA